MTKRRFRRFPARGYVAHVFGERMDIGLGVEDLSLGGVFVRCSVPMKIGTMVSVDLLSQGGKSAVRIAGHVVSTITPAEAAESGRVTGMGIEFDAKDEATLRELVTNLASGSPIDGDLPEPPRIAPVSISSVRPRGQEPVIRPIPLTQTAPAHLSFGMQVHVEERTKEAPPRARPSAGRRLTISPQPLAPLEPRRSAPRPKGTPVEPGDEQRAQTDHARLQFQVRGLLMELAEWQLKADLLERENAKLRDELAALKA